MAILSMISFPVAILAVLLYVIYSYVSSYLTQRRLERFARANGAVVLPLRYSKLPWGIDRLMRIAQISKTGEDILDDIMAPGFSQSTTFASSGIFGKLTVNTIEPANIQAVLATRFQDFELGELRNTQFGAFLGRNIFTSDGPYWEHSRALFRPQFARAQINDLQSTEKAVQALFSVLPASKDAQGQTDPVDLMPLLFRFTLDTATEFLFGESDESQTAAATGSTVKTPSAAQAVAADLDSAEMSFADALTKGQDWLAWRIRLQGLYWLAPSAQGYKASAYVRKYISHYVRMALRRARRASRNPPPKKAKDSRKYVLLDALVESTTDPTELSDQILGILLAGRDTTATMLAWTLALLAQNRVIFTKLRQQVLWDFGAYSDDPSNITFESLHACTYLQHVLREALRVYAVVPFNNRIAVRDTVLPVGGGPDGKSPIVVPKGTPVFFPIYLVHRRKDIWGPDADEFRPERWEGRKTDWSFMPFSGGPRICLGQQFALTEAAYLLARLLQRFEGLEWMGPKGKLRKGVTLTLYPKDGVLVRLTEAA